MQLYRIDMTTKKFSVTPGFKKSQTLEVTQELLEYQPYTSHSYPNTILCFL